jgi:hypothetical protein
VATQRGWHQWFRRSAPCLVREGAARDDFSVEYYLYVEDDEKAC